MGEKGAEQTAAGAETAAMLVDELARLGNVTSKKMFGGHGIFDDGIMFALVDSTGAAFLRADESIAGEFEAAGSKRHGRMPYWSIPDHVLGDSDLLVEWAGTARSVAITAKKK